ncbi:hypothetical protein ACOZGD_37580 [Streptomyces murinus]
MTVESLDVLELADDYTPSAEPHIAWERARLFDTIGADTQRVVMGARLYLREGHRVLATAEIEGGRRTVVDIADDVSVEIVPWLPVMRHLADAVALERDAATLDFHTDQLLYHWETAQDMRPNITGANFRSYDEELNAAYHYEELVRAVVPREDQEAARLPQAAATHSERLRAEARTLRVRALLAMPDPRSAGLPDVPWTGPYSRTQQQDIKVPSPDTWYADLPHQLLMGWGSLDTKAYWPDSRERTDHRDALIRWAARRGLPKQDMSKASGLARTTIDRILG